MSKLIIHRVSLTVLLICSSVTFSLLWICALIYRTWGTTAGIASLVSSVIVGFQIIRFLLMSIAVVVSAPSQKSKEGHAEEK